VLIFGFKGMKKLISKAKTDSDIDPKMIGSNGEDL
jgi:hypothetical protein